MYLVGKKRCPLCGVRGKNWKTEVKVFICPSCSSFFNEFGIILEPTTQRESLFT